MLREEIRDQEACLNYHRGKPGKRGEASGKKKHLTGGGVRIDPLRHYPDKNAEHLKGTAAGGVKWGGTVLGGFSSPSTEVWVEHPQSGTRGDSRKSSPSRALGSRLTRLGKTGQRREQGVL